MGFAPRTAEESDTICILPGCSTPLIIRPEGEGNRFKVIGECYIQGIMEGEIMEWLKTGKVQLETINLC
jgi:hypothetical protein